MRKLQHQQKHSATPTDYEADWIPSEEELEPVVKEFVNRLTALEHEEEELRTTKAELVEEFKTKLDVKTLGLVMRMNKLREKVHNKYSFDVFTEILNKNS